MVPQRRQHARQALKLFVRDACAGAPGVMQAAVLGVIAEKQRADVRSASRRISPADDNKLLAIEAFGLDPDPAVAGRVGLIGSLLDDAF